MSRELKVIRDVTREECPWLDETVTKGTVVYEYNGATYGAVNEVMGLAVSMEPGETPFFEMPYTSLSAEDGFTMQSPYIAFE